MRNNLIKVCNVLGIFKCPSNPKRLEFSSNSQTEISGGDRTSAAVSPEPCDQIVTNPIALDGAEYEAWLREHPSALRSFEYMMSIAKGKTIVIFLDYDGTLSPIVDDPELAFMSDTMRSAVREVARCFPTAIISGRSRKKVYEFVQLDNVYYAGSHGMDIMAPLRRHKCPDTKYHTRAVDREGNEVIIFQPAQEFLPELLEIINELEEETKMIDGVTVEDNRFCASVHFRRAKLEDYSVVERKVITVLGRHSRFHLTRGKKVLEIRPSIEWNKGNALEYLLDTLGFVDVLPVYIGDDVTDEDAFKAIQKRGKGGFPILVSQKPKATQASFSLRDPSEVLSFLLRIAQWRNKSVSTD